MSRLFCLFLLTACFAFPAEPGSSAPERKGLTWGKNTHDAEFGIDFVGCGGRPPLADGAPSCDPFHGDTRCSSSRPILCLKPLDKPRPAYAVSEGSPHLAMPGAYYAGWSGGVLGLTPPVPGNQLTSPEAADRFCEAALGTGFRMAEHHDGKWVEGMGASRISGRDWPAASTLPGGGWGWFAYGDVRDESRFWVRINDQPGNCWDRPEPVGQESGEPPAGAPLTAESNVRCIERMSLPGYPPLARQARVEGALQATVTLSESASVRDLQFDAAGHDRRVLLKSSVEEALRKARYRSDCGGKTITLEFRFQISGEADKRSFEYVFGAPNQFWVIMHPGPVIP